VTQTWRWRFLLKRLEDVRKTKKRYILETSLFSFPHVTVTAMRHKKYLSNTWYRLVLRTFWILHQDVTYYKRGAYVMHTFGKRHPTLPKTYKRDADLLHTFWKRHPTLPKNVMQTSYTRSGNDTLPSPKRSADVVLAFIKRHSTLHKTCRRRHIHVHKTSSYPPQNVLQTS
jgi:hypothetical protein